MPKLAKPLTARQVETRRKPGMIADGSGLYLLVSPGGSKSWIYRYQLASKRRDMGLGPVNELTLVEARDTAREARRLVREGIDPIEARREKRAAVKVSDVPSMTFRECAEAYVASHQAGWRSAKHTRQWLRGLESHVFPLLGDLPAAAINTGLVMQAIEPMWPKKPRTASTLRGRIESILDWATARGHRQGENSARWRGHLANLLPGPGKIRRVEHFGAMPYSEIGAFMTLLRQQTSIPARALEFLILTAARTGEVLGARWREINISDRIWSIPGERMKAGREHRVPLSDAAMAIVEMMAAIRQNDLVFPGINVGRLLAHDVMSRNRHGFRSAFRDWAAETTAYPSEVAEQALGHAVGSAVERAYRRTDLFNRRRRLMDEWARFCELPVPTGEVVPLRG